MVLSYSNVLLFRDKWDGSLRGMILVGFIRKKDYTIMKLGLSFFKNFYKGAPNLYTGPGYFALRGISFNLQLNIVYAM